MKLVSSGFNGPRALNTNGMWYIRFMRKKWRNTCCIGNLTHESMDFPGETLIIYDNLILASLQWSCKWKKCLYPKRDFISFDGFSMFLLHKVCWFWRDCDWKLLKLPTKWLFMMSFLMISYQSRRIPIFCCRAGPSKRPFKTWTWRPIMASYSSCSRAYSSSNWQWSTAYLHWSPPSP